jgi:hypothetical protein
MSHKKKKKSAKDILLQKSILQQKVTAEMTSLKVEIKGHFEKLNAKISDNEEP